MTATLNSLTVRAKMPLVYLSQVNVPFERIKSTGFGFRKGIFRICNNTTPSLDFTFFLDEVGPSPNHKIVHTCLLFDHLKHGYVFVSWIFQLEESFFTNAKTWQNN
jgi:hypothetical protein